MAPTGGATVVAAAAAAGRPRTPVPPAAVATALRREADPAAVQARTGAEHWARVSIGRQCGLRIVNVLAGDLSPADRQDFAAHWSTGWQVMAMPGTAPDPAMAAMLSAALVRPLADVPGGRAAMLEALGECALLMRVPRRVQRDPEPVLLTYLRAMSGYPALACDCAIRSWSHGHDFWPDWPGLRTAISERAAVLSGMAAALNRWIETEGARRKGVKPGG